MKRRGKRGRFGTLLFVLPTVLIALVVAYQLISVTYFNTGTLIVEAQSSGRYYQPIDLNVSVSVGIRGGTTPVTLTLTQGTYTAVFTPVPWYSTPQSRTVSVAAGRTSYAIGVYDPVVKGVTIVGGQFNATTISVKHAVTPFILINRMSGYAVIQGSPSGTIIIQPAQNYTNVFQNVGTYSLTLLGTGSPELTVSVS